MPYRLLLLLFGLLVLILMWMPREPSSLDAAKGSSAKVSHETTSYSLEASDAKSPVLSRVDVSESNTFSLEGIVLADGFGLAGASILLNGVDATVSDAFGLFHLQNVTIGDFVFAHHGRWSDWSGRVQSDNLLEVNLLPLSHLAVVLPPISGRSAVLRLFALSRDSQSSSPGSQVLANRSLIKEVAVELDGGTVLFPNQKTGKDGKYGYEVELDYKGMPFVEHFYHSKERIQQDNSCEYYVAHFKTFDLNVEPGYSGIQFLDASGAPYRNRNAYVPTSCTFGRSFLTYRTDEEGWIQVPYSIGDKMLHQAFVKIDHSQYLSAYYAGLQEVGYRQYVVSSPGNLLDCRLSGELEEGESIVAWIQSIDKDGSASSSNYFDVQLPLETHVLGLSSKIPLLFHAPRVALSLFLMPHRLFLGKFNATLKDGFVYQVPELNVLTLRFGADGIAQRDMEIHAIHPDTKRSLFFLSVSSGQSEIEVPVTPGEYAITVSDAETKKKLDVKEIHIQSDAELIFSLLGNVEARVFFQNTPVLRGTVMYEQESGAIALEKISQEGVVEMVAYANPGKLFVVISPSEAVPAPWSGFQQWKVGGECSIRFESETEAILEVLTATLVFPRSKANRTYKIERLTQPFSIIDIEVDSSGLSLELPIGEYKLRQGAHPPLQFNMSWGQILPLE